LIAACSSSEEARPRDGAAADLSDTSDLLAPADDCDGGCVDLAVGDGPDDASVPPPLAHLAFDAPAVKSDIGSTAPVVVTVHNDGAVPATQLAVTTAPMAPFAFAGGAYPGTSGSCGTSLGNGDSCVANLTFTPTATGAAPNATWTLSYFDGQGMKSLTVTMTATGLRAGTLDPGFGKAGQQLTDFNIRSVTNGYYTGAAVQPDGKLLVSGSATTPSTGEHANCFVARFSASGQLDTGFGINGTVNVHPSNNSCAIGGILPLGDGRILVGGSRDSYSLFAMRLNADGSLDPTFGSGGIGTISAAGSTAPAGMLVRAGGQILIGAASSTLGYVIGQLNSDGTVDNGFGTSGLSKGSGSAPVFGAMTTDDNDEIIIAGRDTFYVVSHFYVGRLTAKGVFDKAFTTPNIYNASTVGAATSVYAAGNRVLAAGIATSSSAVPVLVRFVDRGSVGGVDAGDNDGMADTTFNGTGVLALNNIGSDNYAVINGARWSSNDVYLSGYARSSGHFDGFVAHFSLDGVPDANFGTSGVALHDFAPGADDQIFAATPTSTGVIAVGSGASPVFARFSATGQLDNTFVPSTAVTLSGGGYFNIDDDSVMGVDLQSDGKIIVSGGTTNANAGLVRFNADGSLDDAFGTHGREALAIPSLFVAASTIGPNILAAGNDEAGHLMLARLHASDGSLDTSYHSTGMSTVLVPGAQTNSIEGRSAVIGSDGSAYVGASAYISAMSTYAWVLGHFGSDGSPDTAFNGSGVLVVTPSGNDDEMNQIALDGSGRLLATGTMGPQATLSRYTAGGVFDSGFNGGSPIHPTLNADYAVSTAMAVTGSQIWLLVSVYSSASATSKLGHDGGDCVLLRYGNTGSLDMSFQSSGQLVIDWGGADTCDRIAVGPDGKLVIAGFSGPKNGTQSQVITRLNPDGSIDSNFGTAGVTRTSTADLHDCVLALAPNGTIYAATAALNQLYGYQLDLLSYLY
jgi:uncharacterized delta-60 repeat protein